MFFRLDHSGDWNILLDAVAEQPKERLTSQNKEDEWEEERRDE